MGKKDVYDFNFSDNSKYYKANILNLSIGIFIGIHFGCLFNYTKIVKIKFNSK